LLFYSNRHTTNTSCTNTKQANYTRSACTSQTNYTSSAHTSQTCNTRLVQEAVSRITLATVSSTTLSHTAAGERSRELYFEHCALL
jgi:hypothetical protein